MSGDLKWNKIFGAALGTAFVILVVQQASGLIYHSEPPEKMGYFVDAPLPNGINPWHFQCTHSAPPATEQSRAMPRALAAIYYLNDSWQLSDGGETAFFSANNHTALERKIEPVNNKLLVFEITPTSWHSYLKSAAPSRNSVAQWFFMPPQEAARRFPNKPLWKGSLGY